MLSDVLIPMLDLNETADPIGDYLAALRLLEGPPLTRVNHLPRNGGRGPQRITSTLAGRFCARWRGHGTPLCSAC